MKVRMDVNQYMSRRVDFSKEVGILFFNSELKMLTKSK